MAYSNYDILNKIFNKFDFHNINIICDYKVVTFYYKNKELSKIKIEDKISALKQNENKLNAERDVFNRIHENFNFGILDSFYDEHSRYFCACLTVNKFRW